jgi:hypothetical protein
MNPRIRVARADDDYQLHLVFEDGERGIFDCHPYLNFGVFKELKDLKYFKRVKVLDGTVVWPHEQDICPDTLYVDSRKER